MFLSDKCVINGDKGVINGYAKVNLTLDVLNKRNDGYHNILSVMRTVDICDTIELSLESKGIELRSSLEYLPTDRGNIAYRAAEAVISESGVNTGVKIHINKNIPCGAGMGGGSADGAAVLVLLNKLLGSPLSDERLMETGAKIGADIPFCMMGGTCIAEGIGERLTRINAKNPIPAVVVKPEISISTPFMYKKLDEGISGKRPDTPSMVKALECEDVQAVAKHLCNVMEVPATEQYPVIKEIKEKMLKNGALGSIMTGSGSAVFGIFGSENEANRCAQEFKNKFDSVYATSLI